MTVNEVWRFQPKCSGARWGNVQLGTADWMSLFHFCVDISGMGDRETRATRESKAWRASDLLILSK
jgi:hypothetical protein